MSDAQYKATKANRDAKKKKYNRYPVVPSKPATLGVKEQTIPLSNVPSRGTGKILPGIGSPDRGGKHQFPKTGGVNKARNKKR